MIEIFYRHVDDTSAGGQLVLEGIISPVVSVSSLTWLITISPRGYYQSSCQCFVTDMVNYNYSSRVLSVQW
jgi:hypothetical protein